MKIILASSSPRRRQILKELGINFDIMSPVNFEEVNTGDSPYEIVKHNAICKAKEVAKETKGYIVIGCDTVIVLDDEIFGKPKTKHDAKEMLKNLSGREHIVLSGLAVIDTNKNQERVECESTVLKFKKLSDREIEEYVKSGEPLDKAGAYGIQDYGKKFVESIHGSYSNVIGLPKVLLRKLLDEMGIII